MVPAPVLSTNEYLRTPETLRPTELAFGVLRVAEAPRVRHQQAVGAFYLCLTHHVRQRRLGEVFVSPLDVVLDHDRALVVQPDLLFVSSARSSVVQERIEGAPDMVLEVLSPNPRVGVLQERIDWFVRYGVREIWLLHQQDDRLDILRAAAGRIAAQRSFDYLTDIDSGVLPDFHMRVTDIVST